ncbi:MAG: tRNA uridine-5-carboxymethylaminomethyl(34) synthesis enzyme MnmG [Christensenellales bacterium]|jgi:tRNA uridine 5-carboxymethylaminomethyl modification enzyme|nr:tRNA uridine-5-carboxymethylaminomethyl(34) synthesis enzyme MnmG [Clostridiales bacterium]
MAENKKYDCIVIGAGHAGCEAAYALSKLGKKTLLLSLSLEALAFMACNPNIGGTSKGHLVYEIDALGGIMGFVADEATIQTRMLNLSNGPAVHSLRAQVDKNLYHRLMKLEMERTSNIELQEGEAVELLIEKIPQKEESKICGKIVGVKTDMGAIYEAKTVILATGVYLQAKIITGENVRCTGPSGFKRSEGLTKNLLDLGLDIRRFKTGTPMRVLKSSVDIDKMVPQYGDLDMPNFSMLTENEVRNDAVCYLTHTNLDTHKLIIDNLDRAPMYNGEICGTGARYCPSIEDKVMRFKDKQRHQIFVEPEGADTDEMYVQGLSTSLPYDVQEKMLKTVKGLENAKITRYGYAIEYDCINPLELYPSLELKKYEGLFAAGQINGTSGYEEAAAQGLIAGLNASRKIDGLDPYIATRSTSYIGVLIDDLVTKGTNEPYRMMTSRAEHRMALRQDNADFRLLEKGRELGLVDDRRYEIFQERKKEVKEIFKALKKRYKIAEVQEVFTKAEVSLPKNSISGEEILKRSQLNYSHLLAINPDFNKYSLKNLKYVEIEIKYEGYLEKQTQAIKESARLEELKLDLDIDYMKVDNLRIEARQKLNKVKPLTLAQASRISGVTPADITVLMVYFRKRQAEKNSK